MSGDGAAGGAAGAGGATAEANPPGDADAVGTTTAKAHPHEAMRSSGDGTPRVAAGAGGATAEGSLPRDAEAVSAAAAKARPHEATGISGDEAAGVAAGAGGPTAEAMRVSGDETPGVVAGAGAAAGGATAETGLPGDADAVGASVSREIGGDAAARGAVVGGSGAGAAAVSRYVDRRPADVRYAEQARARLAELAPDADPGGFSLGYHLLHLAYMLVTDLESRVHRPRGWTVPGFRVMFKLWVLGPTRPSRLAELSVMSRSALTNAVNTLAREGLVERRHAPGDRRGVVIALTERGTAAVTEAFAAHAAREAAWFADLSPSERDQLTHLLSRLVAARPD